MIVFRFTYTSQVPTKKLRRIWKQKFFNSPFPRIVIKAFILKHDYYVKAIRRLGNSPCIKDTSLIEYGKTEPLGESVGCTFKENEQTILILLDDNYDLDDNLEHELRHIYLKHYEKWK